MSSKDGEMYVIGAAGESCFRFVKDFKKNKKHFKNAWNEKSDWFLALRRNLISHLGDILALFTSLSPLSVPNVLLSCRKT